MKIFRTSRRHFLKTIVAAPFVATTFGSKVEMFGKESVQNTGFPECACSSVNYASLSLEDACKRIGSLGFDAIDIWDSIEGYLRCSHLSEVAETLGADGLSELLDRNKLKLCGFTVYSNNYSRYAKLLGQCGGGIAVRSSRPRKDDSLSRDMKKFMEELKPELELCDQYDSYLAIENHGGDLLLNRLDSLKAFVELNRNKRLGIALAPHHIQNNGESVAEAVRICGEQLLFVYFWTNEENERQMPGLGATDVSDWFQALRDIRYSRYITPFMHQEPLPDRMDELHRQSMNSLRRTWDQVLRSPAADVPKKKQ